MARVCIMFNYKKNIYSLKTFKNMYICCAVSLGLLTFDLSAVSGMWIEFSALCPSPFKMKSKFLTL